MIALNEFSGQPLAGVLLQELSVTAAEPKLLFQNDRICRFSSVVQDTQPNRNKRLYNETVLKQAIAAPAVQEKLRTRTMYGEANHPFTDDLKRQMVVDQTRCSHLVTELSPPSGGVVRAVLETASTSCGRDMMGLIVDNKSTVAFSMRGMGGVRQIPGKDLLEVTSPLALVTYDWVTFPSHRSAYAETGALSEGVAIITQQRAIDYARDQSFNVRALTEQFELENPEFQLSEDQQSLMIRSGQTIVKAFLETDIRQEFRAASLMLGM